MTYEPYMPWSCDLCGRHGKVSVPEASDGNDRLFLVQEAHAIASDGDCPATEFRTGRIIYPEGPGPRRSVPWQQRLI